MRNRRHDLSNKQHKNRHSEETGDHKSSPESWDKEKDKKFTPEIKKEDIEVIIHYASVSRSLSYFTKGSEGIKWELGFSYTIH